MGVANRQLLGFVWKKAKGAQFLFDRVVYGLPDNIRFAVGCETLPAPPPPPPQLGSNREKQITVCLLFSSASLAIE
jgi:hypothetical protein